VITDTRPFAILAAIFEAFVFQTICGTTTLQTRVFWFLVDAKLASTTFLAERLAFFVFAECPPFTLSADIFDLLVFAQL
jgi:hypothetical protein